VVLYRGQVQGQVDTATTTEEAIGILMAGGSMEQAQGLAE